MGILKRAISNNDTALHIFLIKKSTFIFSSSLRKQKKFTQKIPKQLPIIFTYGIIIFGKKYILKEKK